MFDIHELPVLNASLNTLSTVFLILGKKAQTRGDILRHRKWMSCALTTSALFLCSYLVYHFQSQIVTKWQGTGPLRWFYYTMLFTHVVLATLIVPGIARGMWFIFKQDITRHQATMKFVWPTWLYVSITGVLVYLFLYQLQPWLLHVEAVARPL